MNSIISFVIHVIAGSTLTLGFSPYNSLTCSATSLFTLFYTISHYTSSSSKAFFCGFYFGIGYLYTSLGWIKNPPFIAMPEQYLICCILAIGLFTVILPVASTFYGMFSVMFYNLSGAQNTDKKNISLNQISLFSVIFTLFESLRGLTLFKFFWNPIGHLLLQFKYLKLIISSVGILGGGIVITFYSILFSILLLDLYRLTLNGFSLTIKELKTCSFFIILLIATMILENIATSHYHSQESNMIQNTKIHLVQLNQKIEEKAL